MKKLITLSSLIVIFLIGNFAFTSSDDHSNRYTIITVNSSIEGEKVHFEGKYFNWGLKLDEQIEPQTTPFKIKIEEENFNALFKKIEGEGDLIVNMRMYENGKLTSSGKSSKDVGMFLKRGKEFMVSGL